MVEITDEFMKAMLGKSRTYTALLLRTTAKYKPDAPPDSEQRRIIWEHGRRNFQLRESGVMPIVGPLLKPPYAGLAIFVVSAEETKEIMQGDPAVIAGYFEFEILPWRSFPGDLLTDPRFDV